VSNKFDIIIIGGGIIGSATAFFLTQRGFGGKVAVIEPDPTYEFASTPQGAGGVRRLFSRSENIDMSKFSLEFYRNFAEETGLEPEKADIGFRSQGYLFVTKPEGADILEKNYQFQISKNVPADLLGVEELKNRFPSLGVEDIALGCHSPEDGWIDPSAALQGFRAAAQQNGVAFIRGRVVSLHAGNKKVESVQLEDGQCLAGELFLNTAGPWCDEIARMINAELPVKPMCRVQHYWHCSSEIEALPLVKDDSGMFFRPEGDGFAGGCPSFAIPPGFNFDFDRGFFANYFEETVWPLIANRLPKFENIRLRRTWGGHYAQNIFDGNMIIGKFSRDYSNILTACGFSGHGLMHAPAVGRALAELSLNGDFQTLDLNALTIDRIWDNHPYNEFGIR